MKHRQTLAIVGSGPSCIFLLKHLLRRIDHFRKPLGAIEIFEKGSNAGMGMPYNPETTDQWNMSNISSEELPELPVSLAAWLRSLEAEHLERLGIAPGHISESEVYPRLALGEYLQAQYRTLIKDLAQAGIAVREHANCEVVDVRENGQVTLVRNDGTSSHFDRVVIASGHYWPEEDRPESGYFASPWPIGKLLPADGEIYEFTVGTLGASLSAFDVVSSLAHRHGTFQTEQGRVVYRPNPGTDEFRVAMHSAEGLLPHLQYPQANPQKEIERHVTEREMLALRDKAGCLTLATYFDRVCRPVLKEAFRKDEMPQIETMLENKEFGFEEFAAKMSDAHDHPDAFKGMQVEMREAEKAISEDKPIHWKEVLDDLMYTLNFYADFLPAEDHLTLRKTILPFVMNVVAALPLPSAKMLLALHEAGKLALVSGKAKAENPATGAKTTTVTIDDEGKVSKVEYRMFVDCSGQKPLEMDEFPFPSLSRTGAIRRARAAFREPSSAKDLPNEICNHVFEEQGQRNYEIGGIDIDGSYWLRGKGGRTSRRIADIAFPHTSGLRPYSYGLQGCNDTARILVSGLVEVQEL